MYNIQNPHPMKQMQNKGIDFKGQRIYIGIDVHLRSWSVTAMALPYYKVQSTLPPSATALRSFLDCRFPRREYVACYESGFTGFSTYYSLVACGIECHVVNAADVPSTQYESVMKTDRVDSTKLARMLASGTFRDVYPRAKEELDDRAVLRLRHKTQMRIAGMKAEAHAALQRGGNPRAFRAEAHVLVEGFHRVAAVRRAAFPHEPLDTVRRLASRGHAAAAALDDEAHP